MKLVKFLWKNLNAEIVFNCWRHSQLFPLDDEIAGEKLVPEASLSETQITELLHELIDIANEKKEEVTFLSVEEFLGDNEDDDVHEEVSFENLLKSCDDQDLEVLNESESDTDEEYVSPLAMFNHFQTCIRYLERLPDDTENNMHIAMDLHYLILNMKSQEENGRKQTKITSFF
jgi:hypothetical protein